MSSHQYKESLKDNSGKSPGPRLATIIVVILLGFAVTGITYYLVRSWQQDVFESEFQRRANIHATLLQATIDKHVELINSIASFFNSAEDIDRAEFKRFVEPLLARHAEVQAYSWNPRILASERKQFEDSAKQQGLLDFKITELNDNAIKIPAQLREEYVAVYYLEPLAGNEQALGYDIASEDARRQALDKARELGRPATTAWVRLLQETEDQYGFLIVNPVYSADTDLQTKHQRDKALEGYVVGVFRISDMIEEALRPADPAGLDFWVYSDKELMLSPISYYHPSRSRINEDISPRFVKSDSHQDMHEHMVLQLPEKEWSVIYKPAPAFFNAHSQFADVATLLAGVLLTTLLGLYLFIMLRDAQKMSFLNNELVTANKALKDSQTYNRKLFEESAIGLVLSEMNGQIIDANQAFASIIGRSLEEVQTLSLTDFTADEFVDAERIQLENLKSDESYGPYEKALIHKDGQPVPVRVTGRLLRKDGKNYLWSSVEDISDFKQAREHIDHLAFHDPLTDLPNRELLRDRLNHAIRLAHRNKTLVGIMFLDIDRFKTINDSLGHSVGDQLLKQIANRLHSVVREADTVARFGGDEFIVVAEGLTDPKQLELLAAGIIEGMAEPFQIDAHKLFVTTSIGITTCEDDKSSIDSLIAEADIAMYKAKDAGRNNYQFHSPEMGEVVSRRAALENDLRGVLERGELLFYLQPILNLSNQESMGMEVLMRWDHPTHGLVNPAEFIPVMEESGMILAATRWILRSSCEYLATVRQQTQRQLKIAVNFSAPCFFDDGIIDFVNQTISETGVNPNDLIIEITESTLFREPQLVRPVLNTLKEMGIRIALDDFGTGQSSLSHLRNFPIDIVKIDREFIQDIPQDKHDCELVAAIIAMAHNLNMTVVAEGVEAQTQLAFLQEHGCDRVQGYLFSPPIPRDEMLAYLSDK